MRSSAILVTLLLTLRVASTQPHAIPYDGARVSATETKQLLEQICPGHTIASGCSVCPQDTGSANNNNEEWQLRAIIFGHFITAESQDVLVTGFGCESHASGLNGGFVLTNVGGAWHKVWYGASEAEDHCRKLTRFDGRDVLICEAADIHAGAADAFLYLLEPGHGPIYQQYGLPIFFGDIDTLGGCQSDQDGIVESARIESVSFIPEAERRVQIDVTARLGKARIPITVLSACIESNMRHSPAIATVAQRYEFVFDGQKIVPDTHNPPTKYFFAVSPVTSWHPALPHGSAE